MTTTKDCALSPAAASTARNVWPLFRRALLSQGRKDRMDALRTSATHSFPAKTANIVVLSPPSYSTYESMHRHRRGLALALTIRHQCHHIHQPMSANRHRRQMPFFNPPCTVPSVSSESPEDCLYPLGKVHTGNSRTQRAYARTSCGINGHSKEYVGWR